MLMSFDRFSRMDNLIFDCQIALSSDTVIDKVIYRNEAKRLKSKFPELTFEEKPSPMPLAEGKSLYHISKKKQ